MNIRAASKTHASPGERSHPARLPAGIASVLSVLSSSAVVLDSADRVLTASSAARDFGLVKGDQLVVGDLLALVRQVRRKGEIREGEMEVSTSRFSGRTTSFAVRVAPLGQGVGGGGLVLLLAEDQTESRRVEEVRRDFVANTSHELKTPVGALALLAETVEDAADDPEAVRRFAGRMRQEASRLTNLVQDLITLSRIQAAEPVPDPIAVNIDVVVAEALDRCRMKASARGIELAASGPHGLSVLGDEDLLITALRNRSGQIPCHRRDRPRAGHRQARHRRPWRQGHGLEQGRRRIDIYPAAAAAARGPRLRRRPCPCHRAICQGGSHVTRVLVVEDEESFSDALSYMLRKEGFEVAVCPTGPDAIETFDRTGADLVLLDLMLPGLPGSEVCRTLRERSNVPVIMLTAKDSEIDKVVGLELGADDYVTKPFSSRELVARMRAVLRRRGESDEPIASIMESGPVRMDVERHVVTVRGQQVQLPLKEFELLEVLLRNAGRVLTRMQLIDRVWGADYVGDTKTLDVHVKRLRAKVEVDPASPGHIVTVRGLGYKFEPVS